VASGKGGTGKTTVAVNLALSLEKVQLLDCDVEEPNAHIFLRPFIQDIQKAMIPIPEVDESLCDYCGKCREVCAYNAVAVFTAGEERKGSVLVFPHLCHGCGGCALLCPRNAIREVNKEIGVIETGYAHTINFVHGKLNIGEIMSPPLIKQVKKHIDRSMPVIIDAPPGTSCPMITSVKGSDFCILVTEPTPFGLYDLTLAVEALEKLGVPFGVVINRADTGYNKIDEYCQSRNIPILMRIPFDKDIAFLYSIGIPLVQDKKEYIGEFQDLFQSIINMTTQLT
jgi:MinD superfamily P-loop ATPase